MFKRLAAASPSAVALTRLDAEQPTGVRLYDAELARIEAELREAYCVRAEGKG